MLTLTQPPRSRSRVFTLLLILSLIGLSMTPFDQAARADSPPPVEQSDGPTTPPAAGESHQSEAEVPAVAPQSEEAGDIGSLAEGDAGTITVWADGEYREVVGEPGEAGVASFRLALVTEDGEPVDGVAVSVTTQDGETWENHETKQVSSDADGVLSFELTPAAGGTYLSVWVPDQMDRLLRAQGMSSSSVAFGYNYDLGEVRLELGAHLSGTLSLAEGGAATQQDIRAYNPDGGWTATTTVGVSPNEPAAWQMLVPAGEHFLEFSDGYGDLPALWWKDARDRESADVLSVQAGERATGLDATLILASSSIAGTVTTVDGHPLQGASVVVNDETQDGPSKSTVTDSEGKYQIFNLPPGSYTVVFHPVEGLDQFFDQADTRDLATPVVIPEEGGHVVGVNAVIRSGARVTGILPEALRDIADWYQFGLVKPSGEESVRAWMRPDGTFDFGSVLPGTYQLVVHAQLPHTVIDQVWADPFTISEGEERVVDLTDFTLDVAELTVSVTGASDGFIEVWDLEGNLIAVGFGEDLSGALVETFLLNPGQVIVGYNPFGYQAVFYGGPDRSSATPIRLDLGSSQSIAMAAPAGTIGGTAMDDAGVPLAGIEVRLFHATNLSSQLHSRVTDESGRFEFGQLAANNYAVGAWGNGSMYVDTWFGPSGSQRDATPIVVAADAIVDDVDIRMPLGGGITGAVTGPEGQYSVTVSSPMTGSVNQHAYVDAEGRTEWEFRGLPAGNYNLWAEMWGGEAQGGPEVVVVAGIVAEGVEFSFTEPVAQITGTVTDRETGQPASASVQACPADPQSNGGCAWTETLNGEYALADLVAGESYLLYFSGNDSSQNLLSQWWDGASNREGATSITAPAEGEAAIVANAALESGVWVTGRLIDSVSGDPVPNVWISSYESGTWNYYTQTTTSSDGTFRLPALEPGQRTVTVGATRELQRFETELAVPADGLAGVELSLARGYTISGSVVADNLGVPLGDVSVEIRSASGDYVASAYTGPSGKYTTYEALAPGEYLVSFNNYSGLYVEQWHDGAASQSSATPVAIVDESLTGIDARLTLGGAIHGSITDEDGQPIASARIGLARAPETDDGQQLASQRMSLMAAGDPSDVLLGVETYSDSDGNFELPPVDPGTYSLYYYTGSHTTQWYDGKATWAESDAIEVTAGRTVTLGGAELEHLEDGETALLPEQSLSEVFEVTRNPVDASVVVGDEARFSSIASGIPLPTMQWQAMADGGEWTDLVGETGTELQLSNLQLLDSGVQYRAVFTQGDNVLYSSAAMLTVLAAPEVPGTPGAPEATPGTTTVDLTWTAPESDGGATITGYVLNLFEAGETTPVRTVPLGAVHSATIGGLTQATDYEVTVTAVNSVGEGAASAATEFTTLTIEVPDAPTGLSGSAVSPTQASLTWVAPEGDGGAPITGYTVTVLSGELAVPDAQISVTGTTAQVTGLAPETPYTFTVAAQNSAGTGAESGPAQVVTPAEPPAVTVPGTPAAPAVQAEAPDEISVTWTAPEDDGNSPIIGYALRVHSDGEHIAGLDQEVASGLLTATVSGLTAETGYQVQVAARNVAGYGAFSDLSSEVVTPTPVSVPEAPAAPRLTAVSETELQVAWEAPASDGGSAITQYRVELFDSTELVREATVPANETGLSVAGLQPGTSYTARVAAVNRIGVGAFSELSEAVSTSEAEVPVDPEPSESASPSPSKPGGSTSPSPARPADGSWVYVTPGKHSVNGRQWFTKCEPYSQTIRCTTEIWATQVGITDGAYAQKTGWVFNNLTYLPLMKRAQWANNPLGHVGEWTAADGRQWYTECDTARTGGNGCRSYVSADVVERTATGYRVTTKWVFNNIVQFRA